MLQKRARAKINLGLHVLRKRGDGFHDLETVFLPIPLADIVTVRPADRISLTCSDPTLPTDERNLCIRAALLLASEYGVKDGASINLEKHIPWGAGLGGGSSDAAATLQLLAILWSLDVPDSHLHAMACTLGSDVPFFLCKGPAHGTGRGERLVPLIDSNTGFPYRFPFHVVLVVPSVRVPTAAAYANVRPNAVDRPDLRILVVSNDLQRWQAELVNDFEVSVFEMYPSIRKAKETLNVSGSVYTTLSGSGSTVYGIFDGLSKAQLAASNLQGYGQLTYQF